MLDLLEVPIAAAGWGYRRYDGSMTSNARNEAVIDFTDRKDCKIMLVSLKAGNTGLNLVAASQVIILDPFWNPFVEEQGEKATFLIVYFSSFQSPLKSSDWTMCDQRQLLTGK